MERLSKLEYQVLNLQAEHRDHLHIIYDRIDQVVEFTEDSLRVDYPYVDPAYTIRPTKAPVTFDG